jgi:hypothetical protein
MASAPEPQQPSIVGAPAALHKTLTVKAEARLGCEAEPLLDIQVKATGRDPLVSGEFCNRVAQGYLSGAAIIPLPAYCKELQNTL